MSESVHLALFIPDLRGGGAERVMLNLAHGLVERAIETDLVLMNATGEYLDKVDPRVNIHNLGTARAMTSINPLIHYLRHRQPDALISALGQANLAALVASRLSTTRVPVLVTEHQSFEPGREKGFRRNIFPRLARMLYPRATVVAVSEGVADTLADVTGLPRNRIKVIRNPVLTDGLHEAAAATQAVKLPENYLVAAGRLTAQKNFPLLIEAFSRISAAQPGLQLVILGEGEDRPILEELISTKSLSERVLLPGFQANPYPWISRSRGFVLSSDWEGLPTVLIEALALGVPLVATDCPSGPREILSGGRLGQLVPPGDADALAQALTRALEQDGNPATDEDLIPYTVRAATDAYLKALRVAE